MNNIGEFIEAAQKIRCVADNKVKLEFVKGQSGNQWNSLRFPADCYTKSASPEAGNRRAVAMSSIHGQVAELAFKFDPTGSKVQVRNYYRDSEGALKPNLHFTFPPEQNTTAAAPAAVDFGARVEAAQKALIGHNFDFATMPAYLRTDSMIAVWMETELAKLESKKPADAPAIDGDADAPDV